MMKEMVLENPTEYKADPPNYDGLWKKIIGELFEQFTAFFAPDLHEEIDFEADFDAMQQELNQLFMNKKSGKAFADKLTAVIAGIYASKSKKNAKIRYEFKKSLMTWILEKYDTAEEVTINHLNSLIYFVDYLLKLPEDMNYQLGDELKPYLGEEVNTKMRAEKTNQPPTIAELMKEYEEKVRTKL